ncbi:RagB/SusD family nutrient uptake outer membrane protein [Mangrovibacterium sp.]|uniref:RagB/SusD family nutrient uptake outer membrane protein n=1 Tax=Mangrovibacterium sp. TaxID=1961364 RepID=UPI00356A62F8
MKYVIYLLLFVSLFPLASCEDDLLDTTPQDELTDVNFWTSSGDLELYANSFYQNLPGWAGSGTGYSANPDNGTDLSMGTSASERLLGNASVPSTSSSSVWYWGNVRKANYFLDNVDRVTTGEEEELNHYRGEGYFFRAYYYFDLLQSYGDLPIIDQYLTDADLDILYAARDPRNEVVDFMLNDLDSAIYLLKAKGDAATARVCKEVAMLFKARVALYEGTWEKYHAGTDFGVEGSDGSDFLAIAAEAAYDVIESGSYSLHSDYSSVFNQTDLSSNSEVMLWKQYDYSTYGKSYGNDSQVWPNRSGYTRFAARSYLCTDGNPISVSPLYVGDLTLSTIETNRDPRLAATIMVPGDVVTINLDGVTTYFTVTTFTGTNYCPGGMEGQKYRVPEFDANLVAVTKDLAKISFRYAEALLIYAEAKAELGTISQADLDISINMLRDRVSMPHLTLGAIVTDPDWPAYGHDLSDVLYEIRRERTVELMSEGFRFDDLMRWRAHTLFVDQRPRGAYYEATIKAKKSGLSVDSENYLDPYLTAVGASGYQFDPERDYLSALPADELIVNENLEQNPGW